MTLYLGRTWQSWTVYMAFALFTDWTLPAKWQHFWAYIIVAVFWSFIVPNELTFTEKEKND